MKNLDLPVELHRFFVLKLQNFFLILHTSNSYSSSKTQLVPFVFSDTISPISLSFPRCVCVHVCFYMCLYTYISTSISYPSPSIIYLSTYLSVFKCLFYLEGFKIYYSVWHWPWPETQILCTVPSKFIILLLLFQTLFRNVSFYLLLVSISYFTLKWRPK